MILFLLIQTIGTYAFGESYQYIPITYEDIVNFSKPTTINIAPNGSKISYVLQKSLIDENKILNTINLYDIDLEEHYTLSEVNCVKQMEWSNTSDALYVLSKNKGRYQIVKYTHKDEALLVDSSQPISIFNLNSDANCLIYSTTRYENEEVVRKRNENGYVYKWGEDDTFFFTKKSYCKKTDEEIVQLDLSTGNKKTITLIPYVNTIKSDDEYPCLINQITQSPDNQRIAFEITRYGNTEIGEYPFSSEVIVWDKKYNQWLDKPANNTPGTKSQPCWVDNQTLLIKIENSKDFSTKLYLFEYTSNKTLFLDLKIDLPWIKSIHIDDKGQLIVNGQQKLITINLKDNNFSIVEFPESVLPKQPEIQLSIDRTQRYMTTVIEGSNSPPEIILYDIQKKNYNTISNLNPWLSRKTLGHVEEVVFTTKSGIQSNGYLVHPVNEQPNTRYPLIIATYGFNGGFILDAEWHTTFPTQVFANQGYLTLLLNPPFSSIQSSVENPEQEMQHLGRDRLELFEAAVDQLVDQGIADEDKIGLYGWSHGGFIVNFLIANSSKFKVACCGEGADYNPSLYWVVGNKTWPNIYHNTFGGPPWGDTLQNYIDFCPFFSIDKINTPLLIEYADIGTPGYAFEMYAPLRLLHKPAELVFYKDEHHNFVRPKARLASMKRKVDWFNYWLFDKRDPNSELEEQYNRWDKMKDRACP